ncbi:hypothetical protein E3A20_30430, partial [Planctomyces bekefii]
GDDRRREIAAKWREIAAEENGLGGKTALRQLLAAARFYVRQRLSEIDRPTLVIYGDEDVFVPQKNSRVIFERLPNAFLKRIEGGGHEVMLDQGEALKKALDEFIHMCSR